MLVNYVHNKAIIVADPKVLLLFLFQQFAIFISVEEFDWRREQIHHCRQGQEEEGERVVRGHLRASEHHHQPQRRDP